MINNKLINKTEKNEIAACKRYRHNNIMRSAKQPKMTAWVICSDKPKVNICLRQFCSSLSLPRMCYCYKCPSWLYSGCNSDICNSACIDAQHFITWLGYRALLNSVTPFRAGRKLRLENATVSRILRHFNFFFPSLSMRII